VSNSICIGINPFSYEWTFLYNSLVTYGTSAFFGDYKKFDGYLSPQLLYAAFGIIEQFYGDVDPAANTIRKVLFEDIVNSVHVANFEGKTHVFDWIGSNSSGNYLTSIINSICNLLLIHVAFFDICGFQDPRKSFNVQVYGDDNIIVPSKAIRDRFNLASVAESLAKFGFTYQSELKDGVPYTYKDISTGEFLKRSFRFDNADKRRALAALNINVIRELLNWTRVGVSSDEFRQLVDNFYQELSLHGREVFDSYKHVNSVILNKINYSSIYTDYNLALSAVMARSEIL